MTKFRSAPEVEAIANQLIEEHHQHLLPWRVEYLFRDKASVSKGVTVLGRARLVSGLNAFLGRSDSIEIDTETGARLSVPIDFEKPVTPAPFFVIDVALDTWGEDDEDGTRWGLTDAQRIALVDHELCHCGVDEDGKPYMKAHSVEEFEAIIRRHGLWKPDVRRFAEALKGVHPLPLEDAG